MTPGLIHYTSVASKTRDSLREHFGFDPTPQERAELEAEHASGSLDADCGNRPINRRILHPERMINLI